MAYANIKKRRVRLFFILNLIIAARFHPTFFIARSAMSSSTGPLEGFPEVPAEGHRDLAAVPQVPEGGFGLLEIDIAMDLVGVEKVADGQLERCLVLEYLFGNGCGGLSHGGDDDLAFHP